MPISFANFRALIPRCFLTLRSSFRYMGFVVFWYVIDNFRKPRYHMNAVQ